METKDLQDIEIKLKCYEDFPQKPQDAQMTSSTISSLASPVDSGVQLLDSESELTSVMSVSGFGCDNDSTTNFDTEILNRKSEEKFLEEKIDSHKKHENIKEHDKNMFQELSKSVPNYFDKFDVSSKSSYLEFSSRHMSEDVFEMEHPIKINTDQDIMNVSLTSYELLDYTMQNKNLTVESTEPANMHVSLSEEVNENLKINLNLEKAPPPLQSDPIQVVGTADVKPPEEQIVFRRQRKKKSKSDTPKKRVSFHEDILNSTKIDDIHINHGFITIEPELSFFQRGFIRKPDVVKGRYSWAAEGDALYYEKNNDDREIKSEIYAQNSRYSSTSSSSTGSISSSIDEEDTSDENAPKKVPSQKLPKSSCLKKTKHNKKYINTNIVQEEINLRKKSENILLDSNIFGSLKNILNFSTSVPLAERGVPEGQEDVPVYSSSHDITNRRKSCGNLPLTCFETVEAKPATVSKANTTKSNLKLTISDGFYPNYPDNQNLPPNIILCDSNVYEHKGISCSFEYDTFQKTFEQENKPKSSTVYQRILKELNIFRKRSKDNTEKEAEEDFEVIQNVSSPTKVCEKIENVLEPECKPITPVPKNPLNRYASSTKLDWSDNETVFSDLSESYASKHLHSPKRRVSRSNHYTLSPFKVPLAENKNESEFDKEGRSLLALRSSSSKCSMINRFLKNVTLKKLLDAKIQKKNKSVGRYMNLYVKGVKPDLTCSNDLDDYLEREIILGKENQSKPEAYVDKKMVIQFRKEIFRNKFEKFLRVFPVHSAYTTSGDSKPLLLILTDTTLYISSSKPNNSYCNHFVLPYTELDTILVGPNAQTVHFSNYDKDMQCIIGSGCSKITGDLIAQLEIAMRRDINKPKLPAVKQLSMRDMANFRKAICDQTSIDKDEEYFYYSIVNIQEFNSEDVAFSASGPNREGPLMFKSSDSDNTRWETAYFILKAGVLYMLSSASQRVPMRVFPLLNGACQGARRVFNCNRPHTFQLIIEGKSLHLAAPDEYVASEWLQELIHAASGMYNQKEKNITQCCSLLMTNAHILTARESFPFMTRSMLPQKSKHDPLQGAQALSCAAIADLTAFRLPSAEQSWCILEFSCREVHESSGDWVLYFASNFELEKFISTLEMLWQYNNEDGDSFPLSTMPETDPVTKRCVDVYTSLKKKWPTSTVFLQFL